MSATAKVWGACRALAIRSRPAAPRTPILLSTSARQRWYSNDSNNGNSSRTPPETNAADYLRPEQSDALPSAPAGVKAAQDGGPATDASSSSHVDNLNDAELERIFYGGRVAPKEGDSGLTEAQEETLYNEGSIVPAEQAEALVAAAQEQQPAAVVDNGDSLDSLGHKFPLPTRPYPSDMNHKKRYHPVLDQLIRLMMRDGKLSVAQRVRPQTWPTCGRSTAFSRPLD